MKKTFTFIICFVISALILSAAPVPSSSEKARRTPDNQVKPSRAQDPPLVSGELIESPRQDLELSRRLRKYDLIRMNPMAAAAQVRAKGKLSLRTSKESFDLHLTPNDLRAPGYSAQVIGSDGIARKLPNTPFNTFKGTVKGSERAQARMTVTDEGIAGAIITGTNRYFLQPARELSTTAKSDEFVFYEASQLTDEGSSCGLTIAEEVAAREELAAASSKVERTSELTSPVSPLTPLKIVELATDADAEYVAALGGAVQANAQIASIVNFVDGIYQVEIGVTFQIVFQNTWTDSTTDPYSTTDPSALLGQFRTHWNANFGGTTRDVAHLWTGKDLAGTTIGIASLAVVCREPSLAYGLSQRFPTNDRSNPITVQTVVLTAHEIGHNFAAFHTNEPDTEVPPDHTQSCDSTIMEASIGSGAAFCTFSRSQIIGHANGFSSCLTDSGSGPPVFPACTEIPIDGTGLTANGTLSNTDCRSTFRGVGFFADQYSFNGTAGQRVSITLVHTSGTLDPYLFLIGPDGYPVTQDDDSNGNTDSKIPGTGFSTIALPMTGKYVLEATSFASQDTGNYTITVTPSGCTLSATASQQHFSSAGGSGTVTVTANGSCGESYQFSNRPNTAAWLSPQITGSSGNQSLPFNVAANTNSAGRRAFLLVGPSPSDFSGGISIPITQSGTGPDCSVTPIAFGQTINGSLATGDCHSPIKGNGFFADRYTFNATAGQQVAISATSSQFDTYLNLIGPNGVILITDDDSGGNLTVRTNSRIPGGTGMLTLGTSGTYTIEVTGFDTSDSGSYSLTLANPIDIASFFARQHYLDFLNRQPDAAGLDFWTREITSCGTNAACVELKRINVSAAFFLSIEFQETGFLVYRMYKAAYGDTTSPNVVIPVPIIRFSEFLPDAQRIAQGVQVGVGDWQAQLEANKTEYAREFVVRQRFLTDYPLTMTAAQFVDQLNLRAGNVLSAAERDQLIVELNATGDVTVGRASVLRKVAEDADLRQRETNRAFVLMQYYGYLRRNPDDPPDSDFRGWEFWLNKLNQFNGNFVDAEMVKAFIISIEYRQRFGQ